MLRGGQTGEGCAVSGEGEVEGRALSCLSGGPLRGRWRRRP